MRTLSNVETRRGETNPPSAWLSSDTFPEAINSKIGVSVSYVEAPDKNWYVFRATYGREDKAFDLIVNDGTYCYIPKKEKIRNIRGKKQRILQTLIPNLLFVYTTKDKAEEYINRTPALSYLNYYYNHFKLDNNKKNPPLIIPCDEMRIFVKATWNHNKHLLLVDPSRCHYKGGEMVEIIEGAFKGVVGKVARIAGQQRVVVSLSNVALISTAYIPTAFLRIIE